MKKKFIKSLEVGKCDCGASLNFKPSPFYSNERRKCPKCEREYYVDRDLIDWKKITKKIKV